MFEKKEKTYIGDTIYVTKHEEQPVEILLDIIVRNAERFSKQRDEMPTNVKMTYGQYLKILDYNHTLIEKKENGGYYIFGMMISL